METILQRLKKSIERAIQEEFELFVSKMEVNKNGTRKIRPKTSFGRIDISIPRTRGNKQDGTIFFSEIKARTLEEICDTLWCQILGLMRLGNTFEDIKNYFEEVYSFSFSNDLLSKIYKSIYDELIFILTTFFVGESLNAITQISQKYVVSIKRIILLGCSCGGINSYESSICCIVFKENL